MLRSIKELRKEQRLSQSDLAYICNVSRNAISNLERGEHNAGILLALKLDYVFSYGEIISVGGYQLDLFEVEQLSDRYRQILGLPKRPCNSGGNNHPTP